MEVPDAQHARPGDMTIGESEQKTRLNKTTSIPTVRDIMAMFTESRRSKQTLELPWQPEERKEPFLLVIKPDKGNNFNVTLLSALPPADVLFQKITTDPGSIVDLLVQHRHGKASGQSAPAKQPTELLPHQGGFDLGQNEDDFVHPFLKMKGRHAEPELLTLEDEWQAPPKTMTDEELELMEWEPAFEHVAPIQSGNPAHHPAPQAQQPAHPQQLAHPPQQPQIWDPNQSWNAQQQAAYWAQQYQNAYGYPYAQWYGQYPQQQWFTQPPQQHWITQPLPPQQWVNQPYPQPYVIPEQTAPPMREPYVPPQPAAPAQIQTPAAAPTPDAAAAPSHTSVRPSTPAPTAAPATPAQTPASEPSKAPQIKSPSNPALTTSGQFRAVGAVPQIKAPPTAPPGVPKPAELATESTSVAKTDAVEPASKVTQDPQEDSDRLSAVRPVKRPSGTHSQVSLNAPKAEPAKADTSKQDAPKQESKPEPAKPEPTKPEPIKSEAPKAESPKPEPAKVEPVKAEAPKQEAPKQEAPKQEAPKQEAPEPEAPKQEAPKQEAPEPEAPKQEPPKQEAPKQEPPKQEAPKQEAPKQEPPKEEAKPSAPPVTLPPASDEFALGSLLLIAGVIPAPALVSALSLQNNSGGKFPPGMKIGDILIRSQKVPNKTIEAALTLQKLARKGRVSKNKVGALLNQVHTTGRPVEELLELEWAARAKVNVNYAERSRRVKELLGTFQRIVGDNSEVAEGAIDVLEKSGLVKRGDCDVGTMIDYAKRILIDETVDDVTFQAAVECHRVLQAGTIKLEQAIIALLYCQRSRVSLNEAMRELGFK